MGVRPTRTCAGCRARRPQQELIRLVAGPDEVWVDPGRTARGTAGRPAGRGAYVCSNEDCISRAVRTGSLKRMLRYDGALPAGLEEELRERLAATSGAMEH